MPSSVAFPVGALATLIFLYFAKPVLVPLALAILLAQLLISLVARLERRLPRTLAILLSLLLFGAVVTGVLGLVTDQLAAFQKLAPDLEQRSAAALAAVQGFTQAHFGIDPAHQIDLLKRGLEGFVGAGGKAAVAIVGVTVTALVEALLVAIFTFLMLYNREHFHKHLSGIASRALGQRGELIVERVADVGQRYIAGLLSVIAVVGTLDAVGFLLVRAPFPILFGVLGGLAVFVPYVGILVVAPLCALLAWIATGSATAALSVLAVYAVIHFLEGNVITPALVGHQVNLNTLASLLAVLIGGELWGPVGMLLFIPLIGMVVLALEAIPGCESLAGLLSSVPKKKQPATHRAWWRPRPVARTP